MVIYITGVMGSGKTYDAISRMYHYFGIDKKTIDYLDSKYILNEEIKHLRTNVPYFKDSFSIDEKIDTSFKFEKFYEKIQMLHLYYLDDVTDETRLLEYAKEYGIADTLFVIDECHNYLDKHDKVLIFFFTYHRHFHCEVILITQNLSLVNYKYKGFCEQFVKALPSTFNASDKTLAYKYYPTSRMIAKESYKTEKLDKLDILFKSYKSGGKVFTDNVFKKMITTILISFFIFGVAIYFIFGYLFPSEEIPTDNTNVEVQTPVQTNLQTPNIKASQNTNENIVEIEEDLKLFKFNCFKNMCNYRFEDKQSIRVPSNILKTFLLNIEDTRKYLEIKHSRLYIYVLVNENTFNFLYKSKQGVTNEKDNNTSFADTVGIN